MNIAWRKAINQIYKCRRLSCIFKKLNSEKVYPPLAWSLSENLAFDSFRVGDDLKEIIPKADKP